MFSDIFFLYYFFTRLLFFITLLLFKSPNDASGLNRETRWRDFFEARNRIVQILSFVPFVSRRLNNARSTWLLQGISKGIIRTWPTKYEAEYLENQRLAELSFHWDSFLLSQVLPAGEVFICNIAQHSVWSTLLSDDLVLIVTSVNN